MDDWGWKAKFLSEARKRLGSVKPLVRRQAWIRRRRLRALTVVAPAYHQPYY